MVPTYLWSQVIGQDSIAVTDLIAIVGRSSLPSLLLELLLLSCPITWLHKLDVRTILAYVLNSSHLNLTVLDGSFSRNTSQKVDQKSASRPSIQSFSRDMEPGGRTG